MDRCNESRYLNCTVFLVVVFLDAIFALQLNRKMQINVPDVTNLRTKIETRLPLRFQPLRRQIRAYHCKSA